MSRWDFDLNVNADEIVVTVPFTNYTVTYYGRIILRSSSLGNSRARMMVARQ